MQEQNKSPWAIVIILLVIILCGLFWFSQKPEEITPVPITKPSFSDSAHALEASVEGIIIPDYSDEI
jgi:amino acid transporter